MADAWPPPRSSVCGVARVALLICAVLLALFALVNALGAMLLWDLGSRREGEEVPVVAIVLVAAGLVAAVALLAARGRRAALAAPVVVAATSGAACLWLGPF